jgi:glycosyltransferase involved in cell wall biosynthesis
MRDSDRRVSVVIPTFDRRERVGRAVESVLAQTRPADETLVVDDGSRDGTADGLTRRFGSAIRVLRQENAGVAVARNHGIRAARHGLVAFLDSDDIWEKRKLELQLPALDDPRVVLSVTNWAWRSEPERDAFGAAGLEVPSGCFVDPLPLATLARPGRALFLVQTAIARKSALARVGGFDERIRLGEDTRLLLRLAFEGPFAVLAAPLMLREEGEAGVNLSLKDDPADRRERSGEAAEMLLEAYVRASDAPPGVRRALRRLVAYQLGMQARAAALRGDRRLARRRAWESLAFDQRGRMALRCLAGLLEPSLLTFRGRRPSASGTRRPAQPLLTK